VVVVQCHVSGHASRLSRNSFPDIEESRPPVSVLKEHCETVHFPSTLESMSAPPVSSSRQPRPHDPVCRAQQPTISCLPRYHHLPLFPADCSSTDYKRGSCRFWLSLDRTWIARVEYASSPFRAGSAAQSNQYKVQGRRLYQRSKNSTKTGHQPDCSEYSYLYLCCTYFPNFNFTFTAAPPLRFPSCL